MPINGTMVKIDSATVGAGGTASIVFNSIPQTYDDLLVVSSSRSTRTGFPVDDLVIRFNGTTSTYTGKRLYAVGTGISVDSPADLRGFVSDADSTASVFGSNYFYITNYKSSNNKVVIIDGVGESNATNAGVVIFGGQWANSNAITSITLLANNGNLTQHSTATLYGITRVPTGAKATGGIITADSTYWYHTFTTTGVFTPTSNLSCDYLVIAGGGGGGYSYGSGGGAGGLRSTVGSTGGGGALESPISVTASTNYTITVGAGGTGGGLNAGTNGSNSTFSTITSTGGGRGGSYASNFAGGDGGSGGGGRPITAPTTGGAANPSGQGYAGGNANTVSSSGAGGGGAGAVGGSPAGTNNGIAANGGVGLQLTTWANATLTGTDNGYYAGGGGGGTTIGGGNGVQPGFGGLGGGGRGSSIVPNGNGVAGTANTGGGGGGSAYENGPPTAGNGGSGIVIIKWS